MMVDGLMDEKEKKDDVTKMARASALRDFCCVTRLEWEGTKRTKEASDWSFLSLFSQNGALFKFSSPNGSIGDSRLDQQSPIAPQLFATCSVL